MEKVEGIKGEEERHGEVAVEMWCEVEEQQKGSRGSPYGQGGHG